MSFNFNSIIEAVFHYADTQPDKLCLADDNHSVSYGEYCGKIKAYAGFFHKEGLSNGKRVVVEACQTIEYLAIGMALQLSGAIFVPVEHNCAASKIEAFAVRSEAAAIITCKNIPEIAFRQFTYDSLAGLADAAEAFVPTAFPCKEDICEILFSTGTTGKEKGIVITHGNNVALAQNVISGVEMEKDNVELIPSPLNHSHGLRRCYANFYNGSTIILLGSIMNMKQFMFDLKEYMVNSIDLVPAALSVLLKLAGKKLPEFKDQLRYMQFGAAPMMEADRIQICELLPHTRLYNFYGSTESGCIVIYNFNRPDNKKSCIGKAVCNAEIIIVDDNRVEIKSDAAHTGCLASRGPMNMAGYWQDPEETEKVLANGIIYSNDVAYFDEDGDIILLGRRGDVINVGGCKVSPEEIENAARKLPGIADCGVIPVEDAHKGNVPKLFVQIKDGETFNSVEIRKMLANSLEPYKVPAYIVQIDQIPRSYNGKLLRKELLNK